VVHNTPERGWSKRSERTTEPSPSLHLEEARESTLSVRKRVRTVASLFRDDLTMLISHVRNTRSHFVKCVNPNDRKAPGEFDEDYVKRQFRAGELQSVASLSKEPFPVRIPVEIWVRKYRVCMSPVGMCRATERTFQMLKIGYRTGQFKHVAQSLASLLPAAGGVLSVLFGDTHLRTSSEVFVAELRVTPRYVFLSSRAHRCTEDMRMRSLEFIASRLKSLRMMARSPSVLSARHAAAASIAARRHVLTDRVRREVVSSVLIQRSLRRWVRGGRGGSVRVQRKLRRQASARKIQSAWKDHHHHHRLLLFKVCYLWLLPRHLDTILMCM
jgi:hypothetical protein